MNLNSNKNYFIKAALYARVSSKEQEKEGYSIPAQLKLLYSYAQKNKITIDKERANHVQEIFKLYSSGDYSIRHLEKLLYEKGLRTRNGKKFSRSNINDMLKNPFYYGDFFWAWKLWKGKHEPLISKDLFDKVQAVIHRYKNTRGQKRGFAYAGLITCGKCGSSITAEIKKEQYVYYHCTFNKGKCDKKYIREEKIEAEFERIFKSLKFDKKILEWIKEGLKLSLKEKEEFHHKEINKLNEEYQKLENRINQIYLDKIDGEISTEFYKETSEKWRNRQSQILDIIKDHQKVNENYLEQGIQLFELASNSFKYFGSRNKIEKAILVKTILNDSTLENGRIIPKFKPPFDIIYDLAQESNKIDLDKRKDFRQTKEGKISFQAMSEMLPSLDNFRTFCYENKIEEIPDFLRTE